MKLFKHIIPILLFSLFLVSCTLTGQGQTQSETGAVTASGRTGPQARHLRILSTTRWVADMIKDLSGEDHTIGYMADSEHKLNALSPDPRILEEYNAFFFIGAGYEPFIRDFTGNVDKNKVNVVNVSRGIDILRQKINKLDRENPYYLMNLTNYKIALNSVKNSLQEMDPARKVEYDEKFAAISKEIDQFQARIRQSMNEHDQVLFITESDRISYLMSDYRKDFKSISEFLQEQSNQVLPTSSGGSIPHTEKRIFLYTEDVALQKYADDILKYHLIPVKIRLYEEGLALKVSVFENFRRIQDALDR